MESHDKLVLNLLCLLVELLAGQSLRAGSIFYERYEEIEKMLLVVREVLDND